jgi:hypothetical protein
MSAFRKQTFPNIGHETRGKAEHRVDCEPDSLSYDLKGPIWKPPVKKI